MAFNIPSSYISPIIIDIISLSIDLQIMSDIFRDLSMFCNIIEISVIKQSVLNIVSHIKKSRETCNILQIIAPRNYYKYYVCLNHINILT